MIAVSGVLLLRLNQNAKKFLPGAADSRAQSAHFNSLRLQECMDHGQWHAAT
jgi:hypothetical protein